MNGVRILSRKKREEVLERVRGYGRYLKKMYADNILGV